MYGLHGGREVLLKESVVFQEAYTNTRNTDLLGQVEKAAHTSMAYSIESSKASN